MSWIFGYGRGGQQQTPPDLSQFGIQSPTSGDGGDNSGNQNLTKAEKKAMEAYRFDSSALERAAQAARELEKSSMSYINIYLHILCNVPIFEKEIL